MHRLFLLLITFLLTLPTLAAAENRLDLLENLVQGAALQAGLENYQASVQTDRIASTIEAMTASMPADLPRPSIPTVVKYWRRGAARSVIVASGDASSPFMQQMVQRISANLAIEPEELILPPGRAAERQRLAEQATVRSTATSLPDNQTLQRVEVSFATPTDVGDAFYGNGLRLPQKGISRLQFDIDANTRTVRELLVQTSTGAQLQAEFRYLPVSGGLLAERVRVTSPDGKVDDRLDVTFAKVGDYLLPAKTERVLQRPDLKDHLVVTFSNYRINQSFPAEVEAQFASQGQPASTNP